MTMDGVAFEKLHEEDPAGAFDYSQNSGMKDHRRAQTRQGRGENLKRRHEPQLGRPLERKERRVGSSVRVGVGVGRRIGTGIDRAADTDRDVARLSLHARLQLDPRAHVTDLELETHATTASFLACRRCRFGAVRRERAVGARGRAFLESSRVRDRPVLSADRACDREESRQPSRSEADCMPEAASTNHRPCS